MGFTLMPICTNCGYKTKSISVGSGKIDYSTICAVPAWDIQTNEVVEINLYDEIKKEVIKQRYLYFFSREVTVEKINVKYVPYYETRMFLDDMEVESHNWGNNKYKKSKNFCPKCKSFTLNFEHGGIYFD